LKLPAANHEEEKEQRRVMLRDGRKGGGGVEDGAFGHDASEGGSRKGERK